MPNRICRDGTHGSDPAVDILHLEGRGDVQSLLVQVLVLESALLLFLVLPALAFGGWERVRSNSRWLLPMAVLFLVFPILFGAIGGLASVVLPVLLTIGLLVYSRVRRPRPTPEAPQAQQEWIRRHRVLIWAWVVAAVAYIVIGTWVALALTS